MELTQERKKKVDGGSIPEPHTEEPERRGRGIYCVIVRCSLQRKAVCFS